MYLSTSITWLDPHVTIVAVRKLGRWNRVKDPTVALSQEQRVERLLARQDGTNQNAENSDTA